MTLYDVKEVIEVDKLDEGNLYVGTGKKANKERLNWAMPHRS